MGAHDAHHERYERYFDAQMTLSEASGRSFDACYDGVSDAL
jgi:hypothetical protein